VKLQRRVPGRVERFGLSGGEAGVVELDARRLRLHDLGNGVRDQAMIGMAVAAIGSPGDDDLRMEFVDQFLNAIGDGVNVFGERIGDGAEFAVVEIEEDGRLDAEFLAGAGGFGAAGGGQRFAGWNVCEIVGAFFALGGNGEVDLDALTRVTSEDGTHESFVVRMSGDGEEDARLRRQSWLGDERGSEIEGKKKRGGFHGGSPFLETLNGITLVGALRIVGSRDVFTSHEQISRWCSVGMTSMCIR